MKSLFNAGTIRKTGKAVAIKKLSQFGDGLRLWKTDDDGHPPTPSEILFHCRAASENEGFYLHHLKKNLFVSKLC